MWSMSIRCWACNMFRVNWSRNLLLAIQVLESISWPSTCAESIQITIWMVLRIRPIKISSVVNVKESYRISNPYISTSSRPMGMWLLKSWPSLKQHRKNAKFALMSSKTQKSWETIWENDNVTSKEKWPYNQKNKCYV